MGFIRFKTLYENGDGETGEEFVNLLPKKLTLDHSYIAKRSFGHDHTLFKEVEIVPPTECMTPEMQSVFDALVGSRPESEEAFLTWIERRLEEIVEENWWSGKAHVILHSSGYDSRMLSWMIKKLHRRRGDDWLGTVLFVCSKWEGESFRQIMAYEGWDETQYKVVGEGLAPQEYYADQLLDFDNAWRWSDGTSAIPVNLFWYPIANAQREGLLPSCVQSWMGMWGNEVLDIASSEDGGEGVARVQRQLYRSVLCQRPIKGSVVCPYTDCDLVRRIITSSIRLGKELRHHLCTFLDVGLYELPNEAADGDRHQRIADHIIDQMVADYDGSWYGRKVHPGERPKHKTTEFQPFWAHWTAASLCEHLLGEGHDIV